MNPAFALDALGGAVGPEVVIEFTTPTSPVTFRSADSGTFTTMLMPIKPQ